MTYQSSNGVLYNGDCISVMQNLESGIVDAVITDPPYSSGGLHANARQKPPQDKYANVGGGHFFFGDTMDQRSYYRWCLEWCREAHRLTKENGVICVFTDWRQLPIITDVLQASGWLWKGTAPWDKRNARPLKGGMRAQCEYIVWGCKGKLVGDVYLPGIFSVPIIQGNKRLHSMQKPQALLESLIKLAPDGGTVLDMFAGSGSTLAAAEACGRKWLGIEYGANFCEVIRDRLNLSFPVAV
ncbi:site-specific DNA-methyltransferase [Desulfovibrio sp. UCD-KL4C]|uniref:DNA-methyltransferase n=1 Tax=Desulfovibrio sp. UCD-KL4C TaxID=2578120 RepID=UPI0025C5A453|nr:site-specific DNA-methyltransferase [Desulfovibrio sp. UCD-KL4C]